MTDKSVLKILIVDDNVASAKTMGWSIEMFGHDIQLAHTATKAIEVAKEFQPDLVLLDIGLQGDKNGYDVCKILCAEPSLKNTIFAAQTGWSGEEHRQKAREAGFHHFLVKPVAIESLQEILSAISPEAGMMKTA